jgi:hypothetical protein
LRKQFHFRKFSSSLFTILKVKTWIVPVQPCTGSWIAKIEQMIYNIERFAQRRPDMNGEDQGLEEQEIRGLYRGKGDLHEE